MEAVGGEFVGAASTVKVKALVAEFVPSLTFTVICAEPVLPGAGVTITVRFAPLPPNTMFAVGTKVVDEEDLLNVRFAAAVSKSPIVNGIAAVAWFTATVWAAIVEIVGVAFTPATNTV